MGGGADGGEIDGRGRGGDRGGGDGWGGEWDDGTYGAGNWHFNFASTGPEQIQVDDMRRAGIAAGRNSGANRNFAGWGTLG